MIDINISSSSQYVVVSEIITYTIIIENKADFELEGVIIKSTLDEQLKFIKGSISIDESIVNDENIISGINLGNIEPKARKKIKLSSEVIKKKDGSIDIEFITEYKYATQNENRKFWESMTSKGKPIKIYRPNLSVIVESDLREAQLEDIITFNIRIHNNGELDLQNVYLVDLLSKSLNIVDGSFLVDSKVINSVDPNKGVLLGDISIGEEMKVTYRVKVISAAYGRNIKNRIKLGYYFKLDNEIKSYKESESYGVNISLSISNFKQVNIDNYISIGKQKPKLQEVNDIKAEVIVDRYSVIKTGRGISKDGLKLSGYKLIVHGRICEVLEYESCEVISSINSSQYETPFSTYIVLPQDFVMGTNIEVVSNIENISFKKINEDTFYRSIDTTMYAKLRCD